MKLSFLFSIILLCNYSVNANDWIYSLEEGRVQSFAENKLMLVYYCTSCERENNEMHYSYSRDKRETDKECECCFHMKYCGHTNQFLLFKLRASIHSIHSHHSHHSHPPFQQNARSSGGDGGRRRGARRSSKMGTTGTTGTTGPTGRKGRTGRKGLRMVVTIPLTAHSTSPR